jgi:hypothetical protein
MFLLNSEIKFYMIDDKESLYLTTLEAKVKGYLS